jgi:excisionase family DNA binding protein
MEMPMVDERDEGRLAYSVPEVAKLLGMSRGGAYNACAAGDLPSVRVGGKVLVPRERLEALLAGEAETE